MGEAKQTPAHEDLAGHGKRMVFKSPRRKWICCEGRCTKDHVFLFVERRMT